jgi:hypothetical protein
MEEEEAPRRPIRAQAGVTNSSACALLETQVSLFAAHLRPDPSGMDGVDLDRRFAQFPGQ